MNDLLHFFTVLIMAFVGGAFTWDLWRKRKARRASPPIESRVFASHLVEQRGDDYNYVVETVFDVPGRGMLVHKSFYSRSGDAAQFAHAHAVGTSHPVTPSLDPGVAFLPEDYERPKQPPIRDDPLSFVLVPIAVLFLAFVAYGVWKSSR